MNLEIDLQGDAAAGLVAFKHAFTADACGVFGPSGSGKTTLLETIAGVRRPHLRKGLIRLDGATWLDTAEGIHLPPEARCIGYVPQHHLLYPHQTARQNLMAGARRLRVLGGNPATMLAEVAEALELEPLLRRRPGQLSGGERQRVALGRALCSGARLLLLDEPLASLDPKLRHRILPYLHRLRERFAVPLLIVSHQPTELQALCDDVVVLDKGHLVASGTPSEVFLDERIYSGLNDGDGFENVIAAHVSHTEGSLTALRLADAQTGPVVLIGDAGLTVGQHVLMSLFAHEILLAKQPVGKISARNRLPARITDVRDAARRIIVVSEAGDGPKAQLVAEVTPEAAESLDLKPGDGVFLVIKSNAFRLCR